MEKEKKFEFSKEKETEIYKKILEIEKSLDFQEKLLSKRNALVDDYWPTALDDLMRLLFQLSRVKIIERGGLARVVKLIDLKGLKDGEKVTIVRPLLKLTKLISEIYDSGIECCYGKYRQESAIYDLVDSLWFLITEIEEKVEKSEESKEKNNELKELIKEWENLTKKDYIQFYLQWAKEKYLYDILLLVKEKKLEDLTIEELEKYIKNTNKSISELYLRGNDLLISKLAQLYGGEKHLKNIVKKEIETMTRQERDNAFKFILKTKESLKKFEPDMRPGPFPWSGKFFISDNWDVYFFCKNVIYEAAKKGIFIDNLETVLDEFINTYSYVYTHPEATWPYEHRKELIKMKEELIKMKKEKGIKKE